MEMELLKTELETEMKMQPVVTLSRLMCCWLSFLIQQKLSPLQVFDHLLC